MTVSENPRAGNGMDSVLGSLPTMMASAVTQSAEAYTRQMTELQGEMWRFLSHRLGADASAWQSALTCHSVTDLVQVQQDWAQQASSDYAAEAERLLDFAGNLREAATQTFDTLLKSVNGTVQPVDGLAKKG